MKKMILILSLSLLSLCIAQEPSNNYTTEPDTVDTNIADTYSEPSIHENQTPFGIFASPPLYRYIPQLGASWTFTSVQWGDIEPDQDLWTFEKADRVMDEAKRNNITVIVKIRTGACWATREKSGKASSPPESLEDYTEFVNTLVNRYKGIVTYWAIENEINTEIFWSGTLDEYNRVLETAYNTIKEVDPSAHVLDSGMASMTYGVCIARELYENGDTKGALTFFNEYYKRRGLGLSSEEELREALYSETVEKTYAVMMDHFENSHYDIYQLHYYEDYSLLNQVIDYIKTHLKEEKQIFAVEMGYACRYDTFYNEKDHADSTVKLMVSLRAEGVPVQVYLPLAGTVQNGTEEWRGLVSPDRERRPALLVYRVTAQLLGDKEFTQKVDVDSVYWYEFGDCTVIWSEQEKTVEIPFQKALIVHISGEREVVTDTSLHIGPRPVFILHGDYTSGKNEENVTNVEDLENVEIVEFPSYDGVLVTGFLCRPEGEQNQNQDQNHIFPAVVLVHGGASSQEAAVWMARSIGEMFTERGYVILSVDYRSGPFGLQDVEDTLAAVEFLKELDYVDPQRIGVYGGSHGGYVALMCAWRGNIQAVVEAAGFCDLGAMMNKLAQREGMDEITEFYGGYPDDVPDVYLEYSPCGHVSEFTAPVFIIHGKMDMTVPVEHACILESLLEQHGKPYKIYMSETGEHGFYHKKSVEAQKVWELIFQFFDTHLKS